MVGLGDELEERATEISLFPKNAQEASAVGSENVACA
jgi:hypothetical protein